MTELKPVPRLTIFEAATALQEASDVYAARKADEDAARKEARDALNVLNKAQNDFDEVVAYLREKADPSSDWRNTFFWKDESA